MYKYISLAIILAILAGCKSDSKEISEVSTEPPLNQFVKVDKPVNPPPIKSETPVTDTVTAMTDNSKPTAKQKLPATKKQTSPTKTKQKTTAKSQPKAKKKKAPVPPKKNVVSTITWDEQIHDFGEIVEGDVIHHSFKFTNTGHVPVEIKSASATCGCTRPSFPFITIGPGESNQISVTYNSVGKDGPQTPEITVEANTNPKLTVLKLKGTVKPKPKEIVDTATETVDTTTAIKSGIKSPLLKAKNQATSSDSLKK